MIFTHLIHEGFVPYLDAETWPRNLRAEVPLVRLANSGIDGYVAINNGSPALSFDPFRLCGFVARVKTSRFV